MAKTSRKKKSKQEQLSEELKFRIVCIVFIFLIIIAAMKLGFIGEHLHFIFTYLFGHLNGVVYLSLLILLSYTTWKAQFPRLNGPQAMGCYFILVGIMIFMYANTQLTGIKVIQSYIATVPLNRSGFFGAIVYGLLSSLFDNLGAIIAAVFILVIGIIFIGSKFYFEHQKEIKVKTKNKLNKTKNSVKNTSEYFGNFFRKKQDRSIMFDDSVFEDDDLDKTFFEEIEEEKKEKALSSFEYNDDLQSLEIIDHSVTEEKEQKDDLNDKTKTVTKHHDEVINEETVLKDEHHEKKENHTLYRLPPLSLLNRVVNKKQGENKNHAVDSAERLTNVLNEFGVHATINNIMIGPSITKYELKLETGTRVNKIMSLQDDIKLALAAKDIRIEAPIPGKPAVGVEIPNAVSSMVSFREVFKDIPKDLSDNKLLVPLGKDVNGQVIYGQLNKMPHLLIAGATGSGKSVCINTIICSILMLSLIHI